MIVSLSVNAQIDTIISDYNFNNLSAGNLNGTDSWFTTLSGTTTDVQIANGNSPDCTLSLRFTKNGGGVNASGNRFLDTIFPNFNYADSGLYYIYFDIKREYWGSEFGFAYDQNNDNKINSSANTEKGLYFKTSQTAGSSLILPNGTSHISASVINSDWNRIEIKLEPCANNGSGFISVNFQAVGGTGWTNLFLNVDAGLDSTATDAKNPAKWDNIFFHLQEVILVWTIFNYGELLLPTHHHLQYQINHQQILDYLMIL